MSHAIVNKQVLGQNIKRVDIRAEAIARKILPGQFVMIVVKESEEWIPFSVIDKDVRKGTIGLIFREDTAAVKKLGALPINHSVYAIIGPLGEPASIKSFGTVLCIADGMGVAQILPICRALRKAENRVIGIFGAKNEKEMILDIQMRIACQKFILCTEEGYKNKGSIEEAVYHRLSKEKVSLIYAIGSEKLIEDMVRLSRKKSIKMLVQLNPKMFCATGQCGSCRVKLGKEIVLGCLAGKEFDAHKVDFDYFRNRHESYHSGENTGWQQDLQEKNIVTRPISKLIESIMKES